MAQVTIYVPDEIAGEIRKRARRARKSLSAYLVELASRDVKPLRWPKSFLDLYGSAKGTLSPPDDPPPEEPDTI